MESSDPEIAKTMLKTKKCDEPLYPVLSSYSNQDSVVFIEGKKPDDWNEVDNPEIY